MDEPLKTMHKARMLRYMELYELGLLNGMLSAKRIDEELQLAEQRAEAQHPIDPPTDFTLPPA